MRLHCKSWLVIFATLFAMSLSAKKLSGWDKKRLMRIMANWDDVDSVKKILDGTVTDHWGKLIYKYDFLQDDDSLCHASYTRSKSDARAGSHSTFCRDLEQDEPDSPRSTLWDSDIFGKGNVRTSSLWKPMSPVPYWGDLLPYGRVDSLWRVNPAEIREPRKTKPRPRRPERVKSHIRRPEIVKQKTRKQKRGKSRPGKNMRMQPLSKKDKAMLKDVMSDWGGTAVKKIIRGTKLTHHGTTSYKYSFEQDDGTLCQATYARSRRKGASSDTHSVNCGSLRASHDEVFVNEPHGFWEDAGSMFRKPEKLWDHDDSMLRQIGSFLGEGDKDEDEDREPFPSLWSDDDSFFRQVNSALESKEPSFPKLRSFWDLDEKPPLKLKPFGQYFPFSSFL